MKDVMKRIACAVVLLLGCTVLSAQNYRKAEQQFNFVYVAHDVTTPVQHLVARLREVYTDAIKYGNAAVFYLSNGSNPTVVKVNMVGDNRNDFDNLLVPELQDKNSHDVIADIDVDNILNLFSENEIIGEDRQMLYNSVMFDFYVNKNFWALQNNEAVIAALYFALDIANLMKPEVDLYFNVYRYKDEPLDYPEGQAFGVKNVNDINKNITILPY